MMQSPPFQRTGSPVTDLASPAAESLSPVPAPPSFGILLLRMISSPSLESRSPVSLVEGAMHQLDLRSAARHQEVLRLDSAHQERIAPQDPRSEPVGVLVQGRRVPVIADVLSHTK